MEKDLETQNVMGDEQYYHEPVLLQEVISFLTPHSGQTFIDGTLGLGGHAKEILELIGATGFLYAFDRDLASQEKAKKNLALYQEQIEFIHSDFRHIQTEMRKRKVHDVDGILLDLGISSYQLDNPARGFSLRFDGPLDMRLDKENPLSAFELVNSLSVEELTRIIRDYGEERWAERIAKGIAYARHEQPIKTTFQLADVVLRSIPKKRNWTKIHPATRTFQAVRIAVNQELESIDVALARCVDLLHSGGRLVVIAFHSLEDRIVKHQFRNLQKMGLANILTKKPVYPTDEEQKRNPRSRSARMRVIEKI